MSEPSGGPPKPRARTPRGARAARTRGFTLFRLRGVPIRIDLSWFLIAALVAYTYGQRMSSDIVALQDAGAVVIVSAAGVAALLFFASLLAHELGHAFTSLDRDIPVIGITLFLLGGVTESTKPAKTARDEFVIVGIGPFISLVLAAVFGLLYTTVTTLPAPAAVLGYLAWTNLTLAIFNVLPGYPLDGGRLLRSVLWMITGKPHRATMTAARVGQVFAGALIAGAAWGFLDLPLVGPRWVRIAMAIVSSVGLWGGLIGLFLFRGASDAYKSAAMRQQLTGRTVADVMGSVPPAISPRTTLTEAAAQLSQKPSILWPVGEPLQGVVRLQELDAVKVEDWPSTFITAVMLPVASRTAASTVDLETAVGTLAGAPERQLVITDSGKAIGLLTESLLVLPER